MQSLGDYYYLEGLVRLKYDWNPYTGNGGNDMAEVCRDLLKEWCEAMHRLQIRNTNNPRLDGGPSLPRVREDSQALL